MAVVMRIGRQCAVARAFSGVALVGVVLGPGPRAWSTAPAPRQVVGVLSVQGEVFSREADTAGGDETRVTESGGALLELTRVRTGRDGAALLTTSSDGVVALRAETTAVVAAEGAGGPRVDLVAGEALVRLPAGSRLTLATPTATVRAEPLPAGAGDASAPAKAQEASVRLLPGGETVVRVERGALRVESPQGIATTVEAGEEATLSKDRSPRVVSGAEPEEGGRATIFGIDARIAALAGVAVAGGIAGGVVAATSGGADGSTSAAGQGSPFRPN